MGSTPRQQPLPVLSRRSQLREIRKRASALSRASYEAYVATLMEVYEAHGLEAALSWDVSTSSSRADQ